MDCGLAEYSHSYICLVAPHVGILLESLVLTLIERTDSNCAAAISSFLGPHSLYCSEQIWQLAEVFCSCLHLFFG